MCDNLKIVCRDRTIVFSQPSEDPGSKKDENLKWECNEEQERWETGTKNHNGYDRSETWRVWRK